MLDAADVNAVFQSYGRCCRKERFFEDFYEIFFNSSDDIKAMFKDVDMAQQYHLLRAGLLWLIMHARGASDSKLRQLGGSHDRTGYNVRPEMYNIWLRSLLLAVRNHDPEFETELAEQWRRVLTPGIDIIRGAY